MVSGIYLAILVFLKFIFVVVWGLQNLIVVVLAPGPRYDNDGSDGVDRRGVQQLEWPLPVHAGPHSCSHKALLSGTPRSDGESKLIPKDGRRSAAALQMALLILSSMQQDFNAYITTRFEWYNRHL